MDLTRSFRVVGDDLFFDGQIVAHFYPIGPSLMDDLTLILENKTEMTPVTLESFLSDPSDH